VEQSSALRARGDALFGSGDIVGARLFYERAAEGGDGQAALHLGETYDPAFLKRAAIIGIRGDSTTAKHWYQVAYALGASEAQFLLESAADR
jgi:TPR repeat protein